MKVPEEYKQQFNFTSRGPEAEVGNENEPWLNRDAISFLENFLKKDMTVIEYGSGTSTSWIAQRVGKVYTVEDNDIWIDLVKQDLEEKGLNNVEIIKSLSPYKTSENNLKNISADFVLVDGITAESRYPSATFGYRRLKKGGVIMVDDTHYDLYKPIIDLLNSLCETGYGSETSRGITSWWIKRE
jgi:precorrin-6B methylase 2